MTDLNRAGQSYARSLIDAGKVDTSSAWSFSAEDGDALLGAKGDDWASYGKAHLGVDPEAAENTKARFKYPFAKSGKLYRGALTAIRTRAAQQSDTAIYDAAGRLIDMIDGNKSAGALERKACGFEYKFASNEPDGVFEGYGAVFDVEDEGGDLILPGAFNETLAQARRSGTMPKMLLNHGRSVMGIGASAEDAIPIGKWTKMSSDSHGLAVKGKLINLDTESGKRIYGAMKEGELDSLSIGYVAKDYTYGTAPNEPRRTLKTVKLIEVSPTAFPMNTEARISAVKSFGQIQTIREFEDFLRDAGGFSHAAAKAIASGGFKALSDPRDEDGADPALEHFRATRSIISNLRTK